MITLLTPTFDYAAQIEQLRRELIAAQDADSFAGCCFLEDYAHAEDWLTFLHTPDDSRVPSDVFLAVRAEDDRVVGLIDLRHHIDHPVLGLWGGHIGYTVRPDERGKGYAKQMLRLDLEKARTLGLQKVLVTCSPNNPASERTILACGGKFEKEILVDDARIRRYWIEL